MSLSESLGTTRLQELEAEFEVLRELGRGGTSIVYLARERELDREIAIKVIRSNHLDDAEAAARLVREARFVALLRHPNIVPLLGTRTLSDGSLALLMQHVPGRTLKSLLRQEGALPIRIVEHILREIGLALDYAHRRHSIVHRDIKPENIYLDEECGRALLSDFGIARSGESESNLTLAGTSLGTPAYMSPEQIDGASLDGRSDLYSLGLVAYEMLTGEQPWAGHNLYTIIYKQKHEELPPLEQLRPDIPRYLALAVASLLVKDRAHRCRDVAELLTQLPRVNEQLPEFARPEEPVPAEESAISEDAPTLKYDRALANAPERKSPVQEVRVPRPSVRSAPVSSVRGPEPVASEEPRPEWERIGPSPGRSYSIKTTKAVVEPGAAAVVESARAETAAVAEGQAASIPQLLRSDRGLRLMAVASVFLVLSVAVTIVSVIARSKDPNLRASAMPAVGEPVTRWQTAGQEKVTAAAEPPADATTSVSAAAPSDPRERTATTTAASKLPSVQPPAVAIARADAFAAPDFSFEQSERVANQLVAGPPPSPSIEEGPVFTPFTAAPELTNREEVQHALARNYPRRLREAGTGGTVTLWALIDEDGEVARTQIKTGSGIEALDRAATAVATVMRFRPALNHAQSVKVWVELPLVFQTK